MWTLWPSQPDAHAELTCVCCPHTRRSPKGEKAALDKLLHGVHDWAVELCSRVSLLFLVGTDSVAVGGHLDLIPTTPDPQGCPSPLWVPGSCPHHLSSLSH